MLDRIFSLWFWFGSNRPGFFLGTAVLLATMLLMYSGGVQASMSVGPGGDFPKLTDLFLYAFSHEDLPSLLINTILLLLLGPCQERRWGTVAFLSLSMLSMATLPPLYTLVLFVGGGEASRISGYSATQLALFTAQCRQVKQSRLLGFLPIWFLPWLVLVASVLLLPATPPLLHFCAICIGHNYRQSFIGVLQELEEATVVNCIPDWLCVLTSARFRLPTYTTSKRSGSPTQSSPRTEADHSVCLPTRGLSPGTNSPWPEPLPAWALARAATMSEELLLEEQMLEAGILASLQDVSEDSDAKVEVPKSSISSLRLQQLENMGFPTEKAVVALAASKQLDGAISLLINDCVGEEAVMVSKGKAKLSA